MGLWKSPHSKATLQVSHRFYSSDEERMAKVQNCNFFGHLAKDSEACVAVTGCPGSEDLEFTINSRHSGPSNMYILRKDGTLEVIESTFKVSTKLYIPSTLNVVCVCRKC